MAEPRQRSEASIRIDEWMDKLDRQREAQHRADDVPHPDRRMAYQWTYPCKRCGQMMKVSWDSSDGWPNERIYHNCENMIDGPDGESVVECGAFHVFGVDAYMQVDLRKGVLSCERTEQPLDECECAECAARRAVASAGERTETETGSDE